MRRLDQYRSVEFSAHGAGVPYHFRIWHMGRDSSFIVIREDSRILPHLQAGARLKMKYFSPGRDNREDTRETTIKNISRDQEGRFNGHFLVVLELM